MMVTMSLLTRRGVVVDLVIAVILHLPGFLPCPLSFTVTADAVPHDGVSPDGAKRRSRAPLHLPFTFTLTGFTVVPVQLPSARLAQTWRLKVHEPFVAPRS